MIRRIQQANQGRKILHDWFGAGGQPVPLEQAQARADICLNCPHNWQGHWEWRKLVAIAIAHQEKLRTTMGIHLNGEEKLEICEVCGCKLRLKVHVPFTHIYRHTSDAQFAKYPPFCWQTKELTQLITKTPK